jgi:uncharacterized 2Fe-2S/4Fe-4S cluster protein (DUF4445 family)
LELALKNNIHIDAYCNGRKSCGKCGVYIKNCNIPPTDSELKFFTETEINNGKRLACNININSDLTVIISEKNTDKNAEKNILSEFSEFNSFDNFTVKSDIKVVNFQLEKSTLDNPEDVLQKIENAVGSAVYADISILQKLPQLLKNQKNSTEISLVLNKKRIINITQKSTQSQQLFGLAIDIGTTTIVAYLVDLNSGKSVNFVSALNPQIPFGTDVLGRISYTENHPDGLEKLHNLLIAELNNLIEKLCKTSLKTAEIFPEQIVETVLVGNTVMLHIAGKISPFSIGISPYNPVIKREFSVTAKDLGIKILPLAKVVFSPSASGFIGGDAVSAIASSDILKSEKTTLLIDIGTNSEIALFNPKTQQLFVTSCATGPALEGASISCGMRASDGAISEISVDPITLEPKFSVIGNTEPVGICGSAVIDIVAQLYICGVIDSSGKFVIINHKRIKKDSDGYGYIVYFSATTQKNIVITQKDIRAVQLAKSALYAGVKLLKKFCGDIEIEKIILAGAFGNKINFENAIALGLFPDCKLKNIFSGGNLAGLGACMSLINADKRREMREISEKAICIETTTMPEYQTEFANAMSIPQVVK